MKRDHTVAVLASGLLAVVALMVGVALQGIDSDKLQGSPSESNHNPLIWLIDGNTGEGRIANVESLGRVQESGSEEEVKDLVLGLQNSDVTWDGTWMGLVPTVRGKSAMNVLKQGENAIPHLYEALADMDRYIVSHVLLAVLTGAACSHDIGGWLGLRVALNADGSKTFYPEDIPRLQTHWKPLSKQR